MPRTRDRADEAGADAQTRGDQPGDNRPDRSANCQQGRQDQDRSDRRGRERRPPAGDGERAVEPGTPLFCGAYATPEPAGRCDLPGADGRRRGAILRDMPDQAMWLRAGVHHHVAAPFGAGFSGLRIADDAGRHLPANSSAVRVSPSWQALIIEAATIGGQEDRDGYAGRVVGLILDQLRGAQRLVGVRPWPRQRSGQRRSRRSIRIRPTCAGCTYGVGIRTCRDAPWPAASRRRRA